MTRSTDDPFAPVGGRFALDGATFTARCDDLPSPVGVRPWGLRRARSAGHGRTLPAWRYDHAQQKAVDLAGRPLIELPVGTAPTADTTPIVDDEDGPSSEDWDND